MIVDLLSQLASRVDCTTAVLFSVVAYLTWKIYTGYNLPPGPMGLPLLGYLPFMGTKPAEETFNALSKKYGNVMSLYFGGVFIVVLNSYEAIKEAYVKQGDLFSGRPQFMMQLNEDDAGIFVSDGEKWRDHRRLILSTMRDYGMGKLSIEPRIMEEIHAFLDEIAELKGQPFDVTSLLGMSTANIISTLEFGKRFEYKDERFIRLRRLQDELFTLFSAVNPVPFFPWMKHIPFIDRITNLKRAKEIDSETRSFIREIADEHKAEYTENSRKDVIDAFITERNSVFKKTGSEGSFTRNDIEGSLLGLFQAGTETTTTTIRTALLYMILYPEVQRKVQKEIDDVIGTERDPTMSDKNQMVYTEAVLLETQRLASIAPLNVPHSNVEDIEFFGHRIPKDAVIMTNLYAVHHDPELWDQPEKFMPERFITKDGKIEKPEYLVPFGLGKRVCAGESLARMEIFLYFTSLLRRFDLKPQEGITTKIEFESSAVRHPKAYKLSAIQRPSYAA